MNRLALAVSAALLLCAGCSGTSSSTPPDRISPKVSFEPASLTVSSGQIGRSVMTATDNVGVMGTPSVSCTNGGSFQNSTFTAPSTSSPMTSVCTAIARDAAGNTATATLTVQVTANRPILAKSVDVFGVKVYATKDVPDYKVLHAATILAEYLDNDEDGAADVPAMVREMVQRNAAIVMSETEDSFPDPEDISDMVSVESAQQLFGEETRPNGRALGVFDGALEEVLHLVTYVGYANWRPSVFGEQPGSELANAMDKARGGRFEQIPAQYPASAWYTYDDETCQYECMVTEYVYWGITSYLGGQDFPGRIDEIDNEWRLNTKALVESRDRDLTAILTARSNGVPSKLPDGNYSGMKLTLEGADGPPSSDQLFSAAQTANPGHKISFGDERRVWIMNPDGSSLEALTEASADAGYVSWGPHAESIYYVSSKGVERGAFEAHRVNVHSKQDQKLTDFGNDVRSLGVSPDGKYIAISIMSGNSNIDEDLTQFHTDLFVLEMETAEEIWAAGNFLTRDDMKPLVSSPAADQFWYEEIHWNPVPPNDGQEPILAYTQTWRYDEDDVSYTNAYIIRADGSDQRLIKEDSNLPVWDFSGTRLFFLELNYFDFGSQSTKPLAVAGINEDIASPAISPDGQFMIFEIGDENREAGLARFSDDADNTGISYPGINVYEPKWSPRPIEPNDDADQVSAKAFFCGGPHCAR